MLSRRQPTFSGSVFLTLGVLMLYVSQYPTGLLTYFADLIYLLIANLAGYRAYVVYYLGKENNFFTFPKFSKPFELLVIITMQGFGIHTVFKQDAETASAALPFLAGIVVAAGINCAIKSYLGEGVTGENAEKGKLLVLGVLNLILALMMYNSSIQASGIDSYIGLIFAFGAAATMFLYYSAREWLNRVE